MRVLIAKDDPQLRRIDSTLADIAARSESARDRLAQLVLALEAEREEILRSSGRLSRRH